MSASNQDCHSLFISPHLDDVVFSCALRLLKERQQGKKIAVATVFSNAIKLLPGIDIYNGRHKEDKQALEVLGISDPLWLGFRDAPFRNLFYTSFRTIIMGKHTKDISWAEKISQKVNSLCQELKPQTIFLPLAIGTHIDHRMTHNIWHNLPPDTNIIFYEDRPYVFLPESLALRLKDISAEVEQSPLSESLTISLSGLKVFARGLKETTLYKKVLLSKKDGFRYILWAARKIKSPLMESTLKLEPEIIATNSKEEVIQIEKAITAYKSQIGLLYKTLDPFRQESTSYTRTFDTNSFYAERYWKLQR